MATEGRSGLPAILGWGGLFVFMGLFAWLVISQLRSAETWAGRDDEAADVVKQFRPDGESGDTLQDLLKKFAATARGQNTYVGEFTWSAKQRDGSDYEVTLLWKEGEQHRVAVWRVDLENKQIRPQGEEAGSLPARAKRGTVGG